MSRPVLALVSCLLFAVVARADDDPIGAKLEKAKMDYDGRVEKYKEAVKAYLDKKEEAARKSGNKAAVDQVKLARQTFEENGQPPTLPVDVKSILSGAQSSYEAALAAAVKEYTKAKKDDEAAATAKKLKEHKLEYDPYGLVKKTLYGTWAVSMDGGYTTEWTFNDDGTLTSTNGDIKKGQWRIDPANKAIVIIWGKNIFEKLDLPLNPEKSTGGQLQGQKLKIEAVKKP